MDESLIDRSSDMLSVEDVEVFSGGDFGNEDDSNRKDRSRQSHAISFSFTGIPMSRQRSRSVTRPAPAPIDNSEESSSDHICERSTNARRNSVGPLSRPNFAAEDYQTMCRPPSREADAESRSRSATITSCEQNRGRTATRTTHDTNRRRSATLGSMQVDTQGRYSSSEVPEKPRGRSVTRAVRKNKEQTFVGPTRSASCARVQDRRKSSKVSDRLGDVQLRQSVNDLRRSLYDLSTTLGFHQPSSSTMEDLHQRMEADYEKMKRESMEVETSKDDTDEEEGEEELLQIGPKTAVVPPFSHSPPPPRPETPSRIPVARTLSPRPPPAPGSKFQRSQSVCTDLFGMAAKHDTLSRRNSCDVKISTPLVTGRSSFISNGRVQSGNRCFRPSRTQKQLV